METSSVSPTPSDAAAALAAAEASRTALAQRVLVPPGFLASLGAAIAIQIGCTAAGLAATRVVATWTLVGSGAVVVVAVAALQLARFRRANGVWLGGLLSQVVGGTATAASLSYAAALAGATWAAFGSLWWLVPVCATAGGAAYALSGARWLRRYRAEPAAHARGESALWLAVLLVLAVAFLVLVLVARR